ncbi:hypothetical protein BD410DRAFT_784573 [Rickenella mellea]|uniref:PH domain-containing protein n=1 Tax=Rickenella mellea TaxID=50990 RepID=A0A4Y7QFD1_9AGAM|nr:hypothetical protein BD410DRAFT_784573 [Rickenella mellea]
MHDNDGHTISRAASVSRASKQGSAMSRQQSLIKKNVAPHDLKPSDILIERFVAWKAIVKQLIAYFEGIADIENNTARELTKLGSVIQVPFRTGNQFLGEGGVQDIYYGIRDKTRVIADQHANLGKTIDSSIVQHLQKLRIEIKAHIKNVQNDTGKLAASVARERELSTKLIAELAKNIAMFKNTPMNISPKDDPYVANQQVARQLQKQVNEENALQKSIIIMQQNSAHFEEGIVRAVQSAWQTFDEWQSRMSASVQDTWRALGTHMASLAPDREWISFAARSDHLLDPETPLRNPETILYPSKEDPSVIAVHSGFMERKKRFTRTYREAYYVLTPSGYLHEYSSSDPTARITPIFSIFLPACTLGPPTAANSTKSYKFHIELKKDGTGSTKTASIRERLSGGGHAYSFRARSHDDMMEWWNDIRMLCARYLVASEQMERSGPIAAAVRSAGYLSEDEEEEEEGSSVEEEEEDDMYLPAQDGVAGHDDDTVPPSYSQPHKDSGIELGHNGYATEKPPLGQIADAANTTNSNGADGVARRPSKRQQEKAPEGQAPRVVHDEDEPTTSSGAPGPAPAESKFTEVME